jgi:basic membrane protein A
VSGNSRGVGQARPATIEGMMTLRPMRTGITLAAIGVALVASACGSKSNSGSSNTPSGSGAAATPITACMVLDTGGLNDKSFNQSSYDGMKAAVAAHPNIKISYVPSNSSNDYTPNLTAQVAKKCDPIIAVGGLMSDNVKAAATANPSVHFAEVDSGSLAPNMYGMQFNTAQGAFMAGYLAAGMTKTGKVATFGGADIGPVTIYMDGYWEGVQYYNSKKGTHVQVLGWDERNQKSGTFVPGSNPFGDQTGGQSISNTFIQQGADIIFPVAGGSGLGAGAAAQKAAGKVSVIWVDTDGCISASQYCAYFMTSVTKGLSTAVQTYLNAAASGNFPTGSYIGTLANGGTGLAPYHSFQSKVPAALQTEVTQVKSDIMSGAIKITSPSQPKA